MSGDWRVKHDQDLSARDVAEMRQAALRAAEDAAIAQYTSKQIIGLSGDLASEHERRHVRQLCEALGEPYESEDGHGMRAYTWPETLSMVKARSDAWRLLLTRIEKVDPEWLDAWRRRGPSL